MQDLLFIGGPCHGITMTLPDGHVSSEHCGTRYSVTSWKGKRYMSDDGLSTDVSVYLFVDHQRRLGELPAPKATDSLPEDDMAHQILKDPNLIGIYNSYRGEGLNVRDALLATANDLCSALNQL